MDSTLTRRQFLRASGLTAVVLATSSLQVLVVPSDASGGQGVGEGTTLAARGGIYGDWRDVYREKWTWDSIARCSHTRANCISACAWKVYVKDGIAWREEQAQVYNEARAGAPDFFPRGCQKGAAYTSLMYAPTRLRYPLKRVGERGGGRWKRISWDEAIDTLADAIIDAAVEHGPETVVYDQGTTNIDFGPGTAGEFRLANILRASHIDGWAGVGDMPMGCVQTWGMFNCEGTSDDWFNSDCIVVWSGNPVYTRIPEVHFMTEARYRGAKLIVIAPDMNATAIHADLWVNPRVESDPALALSLAQVLIAENLIDSDYVREQTDLPFLVRTDTGRFLRESDVSSKGRDDAFYLWDETSGRPVLAPGSQGRSKPTLVLGAIRPALEGTFEVKLAGGGRVEVEPVFESLRRNLNANYRPEAAAEITGVAPAVIRKLTHEIAGAGTAMIFASWGACKHYHSDLMHRGMALLMALTGNQGKSGGGLRIASWWTVSGFERFSAQYDIKWWQSLLMKFMSRLPVRDMERLITEQSAKQLYTPLMPWLYVHAGYEQTMGNPDYNDAAGGLSVNDAVKTSLEREWVPVYPPPGKDPKVLFFSAPNPLRRWPTPQVALKNLWPKLDLIVNVNFRMSTTGLHSDLLLPAAGYYEKDSIKYTQSYLPYIVLAGKAVEPIGESREEWWIFGQLARRIQERAKRRGVGKLKDVFGNDFALTEVFDQWSENGKFVPEDSQPLLDQIFEQSEVCDSMTWKQALERGVIPIKRNGHYSSISAICTDQDINKPLYPHAWQVEGKESWPTLTGRQQFYIDHEWFLGAGEQLPVHKDPPAAGGDYPLRMTGGHTRWSIHAIWRDHDLMLRLQRGEPVLYMNDDDARVRRVADNDRVRVFNDVGTFETLVKTSGAVQRGQVMIYHAWEPYQFPGHAGQQEPVASPWKALHMAGGYGQLHYRINYGAPSHGPRGATVEVERV